MTKPDSATAVERVSASDQLDKLEVTGSSPVTPTIPGPKRFARFAPNISPRLETGAHPLGHERGANVQ